MLFAMLPPEPPTLPDEQFADELRALAAAFPGRCYLAAQNLLQGDDDRRLARIAALAEAAGVPLVATNDVHMHDPSRRPLADVVACIREHCTVDEAGYRLACNACSDSLSASRL
jgi:error-prone DNA polymerase